MKLSIIIPVYNEAKTILKVIQKVQEVTLPEGITREILIVDDGSTDGTKEILEQIPPDPALRIFFQKQNQGKTAAVKIGITQATGDFIITQDADLEYDPRFYPMLLEPILKQKADIVYGSRFKGHREGMTFINWLANKISNFTMNSFFHSHLTDFHSGFKLFKSDILKNIKITSENFTFDTEITARLLDQGYSIDEVPIEYSARTKAEGKKITWGSALETYFFLLRYFFTSSHNFGIKKAKS